MLWMQDMVDCVMLDPSTASDGYGGIITTWTDGAKFKAAIVQQQASTDLKAQKVQLTRVYTVTTEKSVVLMYNNVIRRESDGLVLRIRDSGTDRKTPSSAGLNMRQVDAEEWDFHE